MNTRRTRATSHREESSEPSRGGPVTRQTRNSSKRAELSQSSPPSKSIHRLHSGIPQRGTRRRRRRSLESVATNDFPNSSADRASPERPVSEAPKPMGAEDMAAPNVESQDESSDEDRAARLQDILDFDLPKLSRWCEKVYGALSSLTDPEPTIEERKYLKTARKYFNMARRPFVKDGTAYIDLAPTDLSYRDDPSAHATIQNYARKANLVSLLLSLADLKRPKQDISSFLQDLDDKFPLFLDSYLSTQLEPYTLAFRVRCCRLVELLREESKTGPLILATILFCEQSASTSEEAIQRLHKGPFRKLGGDGQGEDFTSSTDFKTQMSELIVQLSLPERAETEQSLNAIFPQDELLEEVREWALAMYLHVTKKMDESDLPSNDQNEGETNNGAERKQSEGLLLGEDNESDEGSDSKSSSEHEVYHQLKMFIKEPSFIQDPAALAAVRRTERGGLKAAKRKLTESQITDAIRRLDPTEILGDSGDDNDGGIVPPDAGAADSRSPSASHELGATGKRTYPQEDPDYVDDNNVDDDDDNDFEVNEQVMNESRRNQYKEPNVSGPVPKRSRFSVDLGRNGGRPRPPENTQATNVTGDDVGALSRAAHANKLASRGKEHMRRERWSEADTNRLLDLIADEELNCSWSEMERKGGFQIYRNQQALRDKARNLKKGYLCADAILPTGFDFVYLSKKEKNDVIASGRNPDRMENDMDERGRVIRNLWREGSI